MPVIQLPIPPNEEILYYMFNTEDQYLSNVPWPCTEIDGTVVTPPAGTYLFKAKGALSQSGAPFRHYLHINGIVLPGALNTQRILLTNETNQTYRNETPKYDAETVIELDGIIAPTVESGPVDNTQIISFKGFLTLLKRA